MVKVGDRVKLISCDDPYTRRKPGALGTVAYIFTQPPTWGGDTIIDVNWDDGGRLGLIQGHDQFEVVEQGATA